jgi:hypothetical protein
MFGIVAAAAAGATAWATWMVDRRKCRRRNQRGACAACGLTWEETRSENPYLIHGRLVCETCAEREKRRLVWHFLTLVAAMCVASGFIFVVKGAALEGLFPVGSTILMTVGATRSMKRANREAQRRIAAGEYPEYRALDAGAGLRTLPEGPTV